MHGKSCENVRDYFIFLMPVSHELETNETEQQKQQQPGKKVGLKLYESEKSKPPRKKRILYVEIYKVFEQFYGMVSINNKISCI